MKTWSHPLLDGRGRNTDCLARREARYPLHAVFPLQEFPEKNQSPATPSCSVQPQTDRQTHSAQGFSSSPSPTTFPHLQIHLTIQSFAISSVLLQLLGCILLVLCMCPVFLTGFIQHAFMHLVNKYLWSIYYVLESIQDAEDIGATKANTLYTHRVYSLT